MVVRATSPHKIPAEAEMALTLVATMSLALVNTDGCAFNMPYEEVTGPNPAAEIVGWIDCTVPDDAEKNVCTLESVTVPDVIVVAEAVTVGTDDRLKTVESVTGMVPPDVATMTKGAELSVTVPELSDVALLRVNVCTLLKVTVPDDRAAADERVTVPLDRDRTR